MWAGQSRHNTKKKSRWFYQLLVEYWRSRFLWRVHCFITSNTPLFCQFNHSLTVRIDSIPVTFHYFAIAHLEDIWRSMHGPRIFFQDGHKGVFRHQGSCVMYLCVSQIHMRLLLVTWKGSTVINSRLCLQRSCEKEKKIHRPAPSA